MRLSVIMPAHNEEPYLADAVTEVVDGLNKRRLDFEVIVVENGSTDATAALAARLEAEHQEVRALSRPVADYGLALRAGFLAATGDLVCNFDVDYVDLAFLDTALELAGRGLSGGGAGPVIVVGSKRSPGAGDHRAPGRRVVTAVFSAVLRVGFGLGVSDTHGLKLLRRAPLEPLVDRCRFGADIFDTELIIRAERAGWEVTEVPVTVNDQRPPRTSIVRRIPRSLLGLGRLRVALWREARGTSSGSATPESPAPESPAPESPGT
jgi:glycosyltransferase involved in cell wall biosynthesis